MPRIVLALLMAVGFINASAVAVDVRFEVNERLFKETRIKEERVSMFMYDTPLYEGLWPMTIEAFRKSEFRQDNQVFPFCIAANN